MPLSHHLHRLVGWCERGNKLTMEFHITIQDRKTKPSSWETFFELRADLEQPVLNGIISEIISRVVSQGLTKDDETQKPEV